MSAPDVIWRTLELAMQACPTLTVELARTVEIQSRAEFGGERVVVAKTAYHVDRGPGRAQIPEATARAVLRDVMAEPNTTTEELTKRHGVSRASIYRLMKRGVRG
jgi:hypothetical protein